MNTRAIIASVAGVLAACSILCGCHGDMAERGGTAGPRAVTGCDQRLLPLAFLEGRWQSADKDGTSEEIWSGPCASSLMGVFRMTKPDGSIGLYENLAISAEPDGVFMRLRHFDAKLVSREEKDAPIVLRLESTASGMNALVADRAPRGSVSTDMHEAVFRKVSGSQSLDAITYRRQGDTLWSEVAFTRESGREALRFEMKRAR